MAQARSAFLSVIVAIVAGHLPGQRTWVVDRGGGGQFTEIQPAIDAAVDGDRIDVRGPHSYQAFVLGKGLEIRSTGAVTVDRALVLDLAPGLHARLVGLRFDGVSPAPNYALLTIVQCEGWVLVDGVDVAAPPGRIALAIGASSTVLLRRCTVTAGASTDGLSVVPVGAAVNGSGVTFERCTVVGGLGHGAPYVTPGGSGIEVANSNLLVSGCTSTGGDGGSGNAVYGVGGAGIVATGGRVLVTGRSQIRGGRNPNLQQPQAEAIRLGFGGSNVLVSADCTLVGANGGQSIAAMVNMDTTVDPPPGGRTDLVLDGPPGTAVVLLADVQLQHARVPDLYGPLLVRPAQMLVLGAVTVPAAGTLPIPLDVPNDNGLRGLYVFFQGAALGTGHALPYLTDLAEVAIR